MPELTIGHDHMIIGAKEGSHSRKLSAKSADASHGPVCGKSIGLQTSVSGKGTKAKSLQMRCRC